MKKGIVSILIAMLFCVGFAFADTTPPTDDDTPPGLIDSTDGPGSYEILTASSTDTPLAIPDANEDGIESAITVSESGHVYDIKVNLNLTHEFNDDLVIYLVSPSGYYVALYDLMNYEDDYDWYYHWCDGSQHGDNWGDDWDNDEWDDKWEDDWEDDWEDWEDDWDDWDDWEDWEDDSDDWASDWEDDWESDWEDGWEDDWESDWEDGWESDWDDNGHDNWNDDWDVDEGDWGDNSLRNASEKHKKWDDDTTGSGWDDGDREDEAWEDEDAPRNFTNTTFDDDADTYIYDGVAPYTGTFQPAEPLSSLIGESITGEWKLLVIDDLEEYTGTLDAWSIKLLYTEESPAIFDDDEEEPEEPVEIEGPPSQVELGPPGSHASPIGPTFMWKADPNSTWYQIFLWNNDYVRTHVQWYEASEICEDGYCKVQLPELEQNSYEWWVKSWNENGKVWSDGQRFSVD